MAHSMRRKAVGYMERIKAWWALGAGGKGVGWWGVDGILGLEGG